MAITQETLNTSEVANSNKFPGISESVFLQKFGKEYVQKLDTSEKNELIEEIMTKDTLAGTKARTALEKFRASHDTYSHINLEKLDIFMLQKQVAKSYLMLQKARQKFETLVLKEYDLDGKIFISKISKNLESKSEREISEMLKYESKMHDFLKKNLGNVPSRREKFTAFAGLSESVIQKRISKMSETEKKEVLPVLYKIQNGNIPSDYDIRNLVTSSLFEGKQKIDFVHTYIPFINLAQAVEIGIITQVEANKKRELFIDAILQDSNISTENKKHLRTQIANSDIELPTRDIVSNETHAIEVSEKIGFEAFETDVRAAYNNEFERIKKNGPQSFEDLKKLLSEMNRDARFENITLLGEGKIVKISKRTASGEDVSYIEITKIDDEEKKFHFRMIGNESLNFENPGEEMGVEYAVFFENLRNAGQTRLEIFSEDTVRQKMQTGEIANNELQLKKDTSSFEGISGANLRSEMKASKISSIEKEIADLNSKIVSEEYASQKSENEAKKAKLERVKERIEGTELSPKEALEEYNKQEFLKKLSEIDATGSLHGFGPGVAFTVGEGEKQRVYTIKNVDYEDWKIHFYSRAEHENNVNLSDFFTQFKKEKAKRIASIGTEEKLVKHFGDNFELRNGEIIQKDAELNGVKEEKHVEYLTNSKGKLIKMISLGNGIVEFQEGTIDKDHGHDDHGHGKDGHGHHHGPQEEKYILKLTGAPVQKWTLDEFYNYVHSEKKEENFTADWKTGQNYEERPLEAQNKTHGSLVDKIFKGVSLYEIIHGGHMVFDGIKETLEHGSHAKSAHTALKIAKWLPGELRDEMYMKVEAAEAEETEGAKKKLGAIDSWMAAERIEQWLLNRDVPQYKLEAAALYMMEKYGHLTAKKALYKYRGKFMWYERLGGRIGDDLYNQMKKRAEDEGQTFSEEKLVHFLLKQQCDETKHHYSGIHRRSRVHKEFENAWKSGISGEAEKGEKDANSFRSSTTMAKEGMGEIKGGTTTNGLAGWAHRAATKGTANNIKDYMLIPSAVLLSGAGYDIDQATYTQVKSFWDAGIPVIGFRMFGNTGLMDLFRNTVRDLSHEIGKAYPNKFPNIIKDAEELHKAGTTRDGKEGDRLQMAEDFWNKYGEVLTRALHMSLASDVGSDTDFSKTDTIIKRKRNENSNFQKYYELASAAVGEGDAFKDEYVDDYVGNTGWFGLNVNEITKKYLQLDQGGGFRRGSPAEKVWDQIKNDINSTSKKVLVAGSNLTDSLNRSEQKKYLVQTMSELISGYLSLHGGNESALRALSRQTSPVGSQFKDWGIDVLGDLSNYSPEDVLGGKGGAGKYIEQIVDNILSGRTGEHSGVNYEVPDILKKTKQSVNQATAANYNNPFRDVA